MDYKRMKLLKPVIDKQCNICKKVKSVGDFHVNKANTKDGRYAYCKMCKRDKYINNRQEALDRSKKWRESNKDFYLADQKNRYLKDLEARKKTNIKYYEEHKGRLIKWQGEYHKNKRVVNIQFKITTLLRSGLSGFIGGKGLSKKYRNLIGCSRDELITHLESKFTEGMNWGNRGKKRGMWQIDHIKPYTDFDLTDHEQVKICVHYTNLQPLWGRDNIIKSNKKYERATETAF